MTEQQYINIAPTQNGVQNMAQLFRENLRDMQEKCDAIESLTELIEARQHRQIRPEGRDRELLLEGLAALDDTLILSMRTTQSALDECEFSLDANATLKKLREMAHFIDLNGDDNDAQFEDPLHVSVECATRQRVFKTAKDAIALIEALDQRARKQGTKDG